jgi:plasmid stability protein
MAQLVIPNIDNGLEQRLRARADRNGRTLEAEVCAILEEVEPPQHGFREDGAPSLRGEEKGLSDLMYERFKDIGLSEEEAKLFDEGIAELNAGPFVRLDHDIEERLQARAAKHGRTLKAEARAILEEAVAGEGAEPRVRSPVDEKGFGTRLHELFKDLGLTKEEKRKFEKAIEDLWRRDPPSSAEPDK